MLKILKSIVGPQNIYVMIPPPVSSEAINFKINEKTVNEIFPKILPPFFTQNGIPIKN